MHSCTLCRARNVPPAASLPLQCLAVPCEGTTKITRLRSPLYNNIAKSFNSIYDLCCIASINYLRRLPSFCYCRFVTCACFSIPCSFREPLNNRRKEARISSRNLTQRPLLHLLQPRPKRDRVLRLCPPASERWIWTASMAMARLPYKSLFW